MIPDRLQHQTILLTTTYSCLITCHTQIPNLQSERGEGFSLDTRNKGIIEISILDVDYDYSNSLVFVE